MPARAAAPMSGTGRRCTSHINVEKIEVALSRAEAAGAVVEQAVRTEAWGKIAVLADPFGHGLCLIEFLNRGYDEIADH